MTSDEYEALAGELALVLFEAVEGAGVGALRSGRTNRWDGQSGFAHQIDASVEGTADVVLVECKQWHRRVKVEHVLTLWGRVADIRPLTSKLVHPILVTSVGAQSGAETVARHFGIRLAVVKSAREFGLRYKAAAHAGVRLSDGGDLRASGVAWHGVETPASDP